MNVEWDAVDDVFEGGGGVDAAIGIRKHLN